MTDTSSFFSFTVKSAVEVILVEIAGDVVVVTAVVGVFVGGTVEVVLEEFVGDVVEVVVDAVELEEIVGCVVVVLEESDVVIVEVVVEVVIVAAELEEIVVDVVEVIVDVVVAFLNSVLTSEIERALVKKSDSPLLFFGVVLSPDFEFDETLC